MSWSFSFQLIPGEEIIDDSTKHQNEIVKSAYSVFLSNKRVMFRFDGLGSFLTKSFFYNEIVDIKPTKRLFISYLLVKTQGKEYLLNTPDPEYWSERILGIKENITESPEDMKQEKPASHERTKKDLLDMLVILRKNSVLTEQEFEEKVKFLN